MTAGSLLESAGLLDVRLLVAVHPVDPFDIRITPAPLILRRLWGRGIAAMTVGRWVFVDPRVLEQGGEDVGWLIVHELAHARQWREGAVRFLVRYLRDYWRGRRNGLNHRGAYLDVAAEREARDLVAGLRG